jgi:PIN domain nuclease of toxin-antitoxin system
MKRYVADTHALFWYLINSSELGSNARLAFDEADAGQAFIYVPVIVIAELFYLNEKKGKPLDFAAKYARLVESKQFVLLSFYPNHVLDFDACPTIREMHDRIIVGAARRMNAKLLTRDKQITKTKPTQRSGSSFKCKVA